VHDICKLAEKGEGGEKTERRRINSKKITREQYTFIAAMAGLV